MFMPYSEQSPDSERFYARVNTNLPLVAELLSDYHNLPALHKPLPPPGVRGVVRAMREVAQATYPHISEPEFLTPNALALYQGFCLGALACNRAQPDGLIPLAYRFSALSDPTWRAEYNQKDLDLVIDAQAHRTTPLDTMEALDRSILLIPNRVIHSPHETVVGASFVISSWANAINGGQSLASDIAKIQISIDTAYPRPKPDEMY